MNIRVLGAHNMEVDHARHTCFLLDGVVAIDAGSLMTSLTQEELDGIQALLLTHRHFDHVRDVPSLGLSTLDKGGTISMYSLPETLDAVRSRLMDGVLYPDLTTSLTQDGPKFALQAVTPGQAMSVSGYTVKPIAVPHAAPTVGYIVHQAEGSSFAYCGDTGGGLLPFFHDSFKPDLLFIEITFASRMEDRARLTGHLTPSLLLDELTDAAKRKLPIPKIRIVHRHPDHEAEITEELAGIISKLDMDISFANEDMAVEV